MYDKLLNKYTSLSLGGIAVIALFVWIFYDPTSEFTTSVPGMDNRPDSTGEALEKIDIGSNFKRYAEHTSELTGSWTRFRGEDFDNISKDNTKLIDNFGNEGPKIVWKVDLGEGHAAPVIKNGKVYILDYNETKRRDALRCFALETGTELWKRSYDVHLKRNHGMSRTVPAITDSFLVSIGPRGHVMCVNPQNGDLRWGIDLEREYNTEIPFWYTGQCPMIDNNIAVIAPGGTSLMIGVDCYTGEVVWKTPNPNQWKMSHSSIIPMNFEGKKMYIYSAIGGTVGVSADSTSIGDVLWETADWDANVIAPSPVVLDNGKIYLTAGYGAGCMMIKLKKNGDKFDVKKLQRLKPSEGLASEQQTPVLYKGKLFGILPKDAAALRNQFACYSPDDITKPLWSSGKTDRFGLGPYFIADGKFFILDDDGTLTIAKATTKGFQKTEQKRIIEGHDAWGPFATADGYLLMRDSKKMVCLDLRAK